MPVISLSSSIEVGVDVGGTFTDIALILDGGRRLIQHKVASTPDQPDRAVVEGLREIFDLHGLQAANVSRLSHGTTVGTNALIQRRCGRVAVLTSTGFRDLLEIGRQTRPEVYDIHRDHPPPIVPRELRLEVPERRLFDGTVHVPLDRDAVEKAAGLFGAAKVDCVVVCFLHSYAFPEDERCAAEILRQNLSDSVAVLTSSSVYPEFREYERFSTAVLNGALLTIIGSYLDRLAHSAEQLGIKPEIKISQSSGGLMSARMARRLPVRACLSGPAAGVRGAERRAGLAGFGNLITLDVGGTSADVCLLREGIPSEVDECDLAGFPIRMPALDVIAVGAGGGSIAWIDRDGLLKVGPQSAGAHPGPACYALGGEDATVTDANVILGRLNGETLLDGRMPIDRSCAEKAIANLASRLEMAPGETALGIVKVASAVMGKAIRSVSVERGHDPREFTLFAYGGAGPLHAVDIARDLGIPRVIVPPSPGILCAEGAMSALLTAEYVRAVLAGLNAGGVQALRTVFKAMQTEISSWYEEEDVPIDNRSVRWHAGVRYFGQNYELPVGVRFDLDDAALAESISAEFRRVHEASYGFAAEDEPVQIVHLMAKAVALQTYAGLPELRTGNSATAFGERTADFGERNRMAAPLFRRSELRLGIRIEGPAIIEQMDATVLVFPGDTCEVDRWGNLTISLKE